MEKIQKMLESDEIWGWVAKGSFSLEIKVQMEESEREILENNLVSLLRKIFNTRLRSSSLSLWNLGVNCQRFCWGGEDVKEWFRKINLACICLVNLCSQFCTEADWRIMALKAWKSIKRLLTGNSVVPRVWLWNAWTGVVGVESKN